MSAETVTEIAKLYQQKRDEGLALQDAAANQPDIDGMIATCAKASECFATAAGIHQALQVVVSNSMEPIGNFDGLMDNPEMMPGVHKEVV